MSASTDPTAGRGHGQFISRISSRLRSEAGAQVRALTRSNSGLTLDYDNPPGDPGLFGPDAVCWRVHADFPAMLAGGVSALLMQTLHPLALAGVWDHSTFRADMQGRLGRTAQFIAGTTYGSRADAMALIARVRRIHSHIRGSGLDGRPYAADDPALLTWVHVAEVSSFMAGYLRYVGPLGNAEQDRYYDEVAQIAELLGASDVPRSSAAIAAYLEAMRPQLEASARTREVARLVMKMPVANPMLLPAVRVMAYAGIALLPDWARRMLDLDGPSIRRPASLAGMRVLAPTLRWALGPGLAARARRRVARGA
ncbi:MULTISPECIES: oxygenase MpaB family protein [Cupriavidus]|uniref:oxygenase MpaB family protein n=1 Tax=Cupriavidus TaxID=106589 RepID=UPI000039EB3B|nr:MULTISPECIES: oxygenase MpaB family protein [Cupriavidus]QYY27921.1 oxygenase MpaB family protein [Cupriavidus pinatubonensis]